MLRTHYLGALMTLVYITVRRIPADPGVDAPIEANLEFSGDTWMDALDAAYAWLKDNRKDTHTYYVWL